MKKYLFMALLVSLFLLPGCSKDSKNDPTPEPVVDNVIVEAFEYSKDFVGADSATTLAQLLNDGYTLYQTKDEGFSVTKTSGGLLTMVALDTEKSVVTSVYVMMGDMTDETALCDGETFRELMVYMGESYSSGDQVWPFSAMRYEEGGEDVTEYDYSVALENVATACDNGDVKLLWAEGTTGVMFSKIYSSQEKHDFVTILIM